MVVASTGFSKSLVAAVVVVEVVVAEKEKEKKNEKKFVLKTSVWVRVYS
jgi:hypothetical protein